MSNFTPNYMQGLGGMGSFQPQMPMGLSMPIPGVSCPNACGSPCAGVCAGPQCMNACGNGCGNPCGGLGMCSQNMCPPTQCRNQCPCASMQSNMCSMQPPSPYYGASPMTSPCMSAPIAGPQFQRTEGYTSNNICIPPITPYMIVNGQPQPMVGPPPQLLWNEQ